MAAPTQPLALSATYLAMLQARQHRPAPPPAPTNSAPRPTTAQSPAASPAPPGRGRLIDIIA